MAPARAYWKGYLKLSLVSCPIALYTGTASTERVSFRQINKQTGNRLRQLLVDEVTREPVDGADKGRGYEYAKNAYIPVDDDELDAIAIESTHTIEIDSFVPREQIDERYLDSPYYIMPHERVGQEAFAVMREAMRGKGVVALGRVVLAKRERVIMVQPWDGPVDLYLYSYAREALRRWLRRRPLSPIFFLANPGAGWSRGWTSGCRGERPDLWGRHVIAGLLRTAAGGPR